MRPWPIQMSIVYRNSNPNNLRSEQRSEISNYLSLFLYINGIKPKGWPRTSLKSDPMGQVHCTIALCSAYSF